MILVFFQLCYFVSNNGCTCIVYISFILFLQAFDLMLPGRVLLHEEELQIVEKKKKRKIVLFLFSDILLITKKTGRSFAVLEPPVPLQDMIVQDINCGQGIVAHVMCI